MTLDEKKVLYRDACRVVCHLANQIETVFGQLAKIADSDTPENTIDAMLPTADSFMQGLGDAMSERDMVDEAEDAWVNPIYDRMRSWRDEAFRPNAF